VSRPDVVGGEQTWLYFFFLGGGFIMGFVFCYGCMFTFVVFNLVSQY